jgi:DNA-binding beta-propeller fold protein YncE
LVRDGETGRHRIVALAALTAAVTGLAAATAAPSAPSGSVPSSRIVAVVPATSLGVSPHTITAKTRSVRHFEYALPDGEIDVYDIDRGQRRIQRILLPQARGIRGVVANVRTRILYVSFGGDGGPSGNGSMLAYDLVRDRVLWQRSYGAGIDSMAITPDGRTIYMPEGEQSAIPDWFAIRADTGQPTAVISAGAGPHNTIVSPDGAFAYLGSRNDPNLWVASTATNQIVKKIGPLRGGVRPFTVNGAQTLAFTTATGFLGFQVSSLETGRVLYTIDFRDLGFAYDPATFAASTPSHGISLSPDEKQLYVMDAANGYIHVFDVSGLPSSTPTHVADIELQHPVSGSESPCLYDCLRDGWVQHSRDGRYVYVGDSGDVISTATRSVVAFLPALRNTRKSLEIDWRHGVPVATTSRYGLGYVHPHG